MPAKTITILCSVWLVSGCGRPPGVRTYTEVTQGLSAVAKENGVEDKGGMGSLATAGQNLPEGHPPIAGGKGAEGVGANVMKGREGEVPPASSGGDLEWKVPEGWESYGASGMRLGSFAPEGAPEGTLATLIVLPKIPGNLEANIGRWRGQVGLEKEGGSEPIRLVGRLPYQLVNLVPESVSAGAAQSLIGAVYDLGDREVFLKYMGDTQTLVASKGGFLELAGSLGRKGEGDL